MGKGGRDRSLDDVQVMGVWNFTIQAETPLYWLRTGNLDRYLLRFNLHTSFPCTAGLIFHAEADGSGTDGVSFWMERRKNKEGQCQKKYLLAGNGLDSKAVATRGFPDDGGDMSEEVELLVQGYSGVILLQNRKVSIKFRTKPGRGSIGFYNTSEAEDSDVLFADVRVTALRRGPMEIGGTLGRREHSIQGRAAEIAAMSETEGPGVYAGEAPEDEEEIAPVMPSRTGKYASQVTGYTASTAFPESPTAMTSFNQHSSSNWNASKSTSSYGMRDTWTQARHTSIGGPVYSRARMLDTGPGLSPMPSQSQQMQSTSQQLPQMRKSTSAMWRPGHESAANARKVRLQASGSEGALRKSGGAVMGMKSASQTFGGLTQHSDSSVTWMATAKNAPMGGQKFIQEYASPSLTKSRPGKLGRADACDEFISMNAP